MGVKTLWDPSGARVLKDTPSCQMVVVKTLMNARHTNMTVWRNKSVRTQKGHTPASPTVLQDLNNKLMLLVLMLMSVQREYQAVTTLRSVQILGVHMCVPVPKGSGLQVPANLV